MKRLGLLWLLSFASLMPLQAQRLKYMDLLQIMDGMSREEYRNTLQEFLSIEIDHPHANLLLALYYEKNYKSADPLTRYAYALANANEAKIRLIKANIIVDDREVSRNNEYYAHTFRSTGPNAKLFVDYPIVSKRISDAVDSATLFLKKIPPIYQAFTRSVRNYDKAVKLFASLNLEFLTLDDLYLFYNQETESRLKSLKQASDSARFYFEAYLGLTRDYPLTFHKQKYHVRNINTYRLDGLITRMNFLTPDVEFWDYGKWADQITASITVEITPMRRLLNQNEEKLDANLAKINASPIGEGMMPARPDKQIIYNLNNYDKQSLALALLEYKTVRQDLLLRTKTFHADTINSQHNAESYSAMIYLDRTADTLLNEIRVRSTADKIKKHQGFIDKYYGGAAGLTRFAEDEGKWVNTLFTQYSGELRASVTAMTVPEVISEKDRMLRFGKWNVSLLPHGPEQIDKGDPVTLQRRRSPDGSSYLAGVFKPDHKLNNVVAFVARVNPDGKAGWMQSFNIKVDSAATLADAANYPGPIELTQEGCALVVQSVNKSKTDKRNTFIYLNEKGEEKFRVRMKEKDFPRKLNYIERSNSFVVLSKGAEEAISHASSESVTLTGINAVGDVLWRHEALLTGSIAELTNLADGFLVSGNYAAVTISGKEYKTSGPDVSNPFLLRLTEKGEVAQVNVLQIPRSVYVTHVIKVGDNSIHLIGAEGGFPQPGNSLSQEAARIHIMTNRSCQVVFSNY